MQVHEFRRELQDAILRLQHIAQKIDDDHLKEVEQTEVDTARNNAVAQARREIETGVTHPDVTPVSKPEPIEAKERQLALEQRAASKAKEK